VVVETCALPPFRILNKASFIRYRVNGAVYEWRVMRLAEVVNAVNAARPHAGFRVLLPSWSLLFRDGTNDQLASACFDERRISLRLGGIKQFLNSRTA
jgi:hypothetical protein